MGSLGFELVLLCRCGLPDSTPFGPSPSELQGVQLAFEDEKLLVTAEARRPAVRCPACGAWSRRIHSRYPRTLADLPWLRCAVRLQVRRRKFFCDQAGCPRRIFAEPLLSTAARDGRRTTRAAQLLGVCSALR